MSKNGMERNGMGREEEEEEERERTGQPQERVTDVIHWNRTNMLRTASQGYLPKQSKAEQVGVNGCVGYCH